MAEICAVIERKDEIVPETVIGEGLCTVYRAVTFVLVDAGSKPSIMNVR